jgi:hypothetical protein
MMGSLGKKCRPGLALAVNERTMGGCPMTVNAALLFPWFDFGRDQTGTGWNLGFSFFVLFLPRHHTPLIRGEG